MEEIKETIGKLQKLKEKDDSDRREYEIQALDKILKDYYKKHKIKPAMKSVHSQIFDKKTGLQACEDFESFQGRFDSFPTGLPNKHYHIYQLHKDIFTRIISDLAKILGFQREFSTQAAEKSHESNDNSLDRINSEMKKIEEMSENYLSSFEVRPYDMNKIHDIIFDPFRGIRCCKTVIEFNQKTDEFLQGKSLNSNPGNQFEAEREERIKDFLLNPIHQLHFQKVFGSVKYLLFQIESMLDLSDSWIQTHNAIKEIKIQSLEVEVENLTREGIPTIDSFTEAPLILSKIFNDVTGIILCQSPDSFKKKVKKFFEWNYDPSKEVYSVVNSAKIKTFLANHKSIFSRVFKDIEYLLFNADFQQLMKFESEVIKLKTDMDKFRGSAHADEFKRLTMLFDQKKELIEVLGEKGGDEINPFTKQLISKIEAYIQTLLAKSTKVSL